MIIFVLQDTNTLSFSRTNLLVFNIARESWSFFF